jgi:BirA family biotin operon repressor/biotin-[acetyl-CoA-carboxylase] ligase
VIAMPTLPPEANQVLDECESTNDLARKLGEAGAPHGTWVSARRQTAGRGRVGRAWRTIEGNLFLSLVARVEEKAHWTWVPLTAAVGVARAVAPFASGRVEIKWPNDLWISGAKLGGILCEAIGSRDGSFIVIGLGLNCFARPELPEQATADLGGVHADAIRGEVVDAILSALDELKASGPGPIARAYEEQAAFPRGTRVQWQDTKSGATIEGVTESLGPAGELRVAIEGRGTIPLYAEDIRAVRIASGGSRP